MNEIIPHKNSFELNNCETISRGDFFGLAG